jgi:glycosyltransferase involved in cell wall biosynthesis
MYWERKIQTWFALLDERNGDQVHRTSDLCYRMIESGALDVTIVIPAFNEAKRLPRTLDSLTAWIELRPERFEVIVVDDGSTDNTASLAQAYSTVTFVSLPKNAGKGAAVRHGMLLGQGALILMMDADLATPMSEFDVLKESIMSGADVAIGSRPLRTSRLSVRQPILRELAGRMFNFIVRLVSGLPIRDTQCGFKLWRSVAAKNCFRICLIDGFAFDVESLVVAKALGYSIVEIGVSWAHQPGAAAFGSASSYVHHALKMIVDTVAIRWNHRAVRRV